MTPTLAVSPAESVVWKNARISVVEGCFYAAMVALGESFMIPWALALGFRPTQIAVLATLPVALGGFAQFLTPRLEDLFPSRKVYVIFLMALQVAGLIIMGLQPFPDYGTFMLGSILYWVGGAGCHPIWSEWMIPLDPSHDVSTYHGRRGALVSFVSFLLFIASGFLLTNRVNPQIFHWLFLGSGIARLLCMLLIAFHDDVPKKTWKAQMREEKTDVLHLRGKSVRGFVLFLILGLMVFRGGAGIASPHFTQHMLENLKMSYIVFTIMVACTFLGRTIFLESWIASSNRFGSHKTLLMGCMFLAFVPSLWLVSHNYFWIGAIQGVAGTAWAVLDQLTLIILAGLGLREWSRYLGLLGMLCTLMALLGGWAGGKMLEMGYPMEMVFVASTIVRLMGAICLLWVFKKHHDEDLTPRHMIPIFFSALSLRPSLESINRLLWRKEKDQAE